MDKISKQQKGDLLREQKKKKKKKREKNDRTKYLFIPGEHETVTWLHNCF